MPLTTRYRDGMQLIEAVREYLRENPGAREHLLWADNPAASRYGLTTGSRSWEIDAIHVRGSESFTTLDGKDRLLRILKGHKPKPPVTDRRYGNTRAWDYIRDPDDVLPIPHVHACPECYEYVPCEMECALEPDLELDDGTPCGAHCVCDACRNRMEKTGQKSTSDAEHASSHPVR